MAFAETTALVPLESAEGTTVDMAIARLSLEAEALARATPIDVCGVPIRFATEQPRPGVNWNDRCIARFAAPHGSGVGELEFGALVPNEEAADE